MSGKIYTPSQTSELTGDPSNPENKYADVTGTTIGNKRGIDTQDIPQAIQVDASTSGTTYVGFASPGATVSNAVWRVMRIVQNGSNTDVKFADGNFEFDNIWDDRMSLNYE